MAPVWGQIFVWLQIDVYLVSNWQNVNTLKLRNYSSAEPSQSVISAPVGLALPHLGVFVYVDQNYPLMSHNKYKQT